MIEMQCDALGCRYAQRAFSELNHLQQAPADDDGMTQHLAEALPGTTAWLAAAAAHRDSLSNIPASPSAALASDLPHAQEPSIGGYNGLPTTMRTGGRRPNNLPHRSAVQRRPQHISLDDGLAPTSWQAALRCGLVHIITSEQPAHGSTGAFSAGIQGVRFKPIVFSSNICSNVVFPCWAFPKYQVLALQYICLQGRWCLTGAHAPNHKECFIAEESQV